MLTNLSEFSPKTPTPKIWLPAIKASILHALVPNYCHTESHHSYIANLHYSFIILTFYVYSSDIRSL